MNIIPRPPQVEAINAVLPALRKYGIALMVMATGLGKTIGSALIMRKLKSFPGIFLVHNNDILEQAMSDFRKVFGKSIRIGLFNGDSKDIAGCHIVFASFQMMKGHLRKFKRNQFTWMIVDEGHHAHARTFRRVIEYFLCPRLAMTATPDRTDMKNIRELFGDEVVNIPLEKAIARGWLPPIEYHLITDEGLDEARLAEVTREVTKEGRRISIEEINRRVFIRARDEKIAKMIESYDLPTVIFCRSIDHADHMKDFFRSAETYHSDKKRMARNAIMDNFREGRTRRILAVNAFNEGVHISSVGLLVFNRTTDSEGIFRQQLGRGLETGKDKLIVLDLVGNIERIQRIKKMTDEIARHHEEFASSADLTREGYTKEVFHLSGKGFNFTFADKVVDLMRLAERVEVDFYPTWQEAQKAAIPLGIKTALEYARNYKKDFRLPCSPHQVFTDFPGWNVFLNTGKYSTWQAASQAARSLGVSKKHEYSNKYRVDPKLPSSPNVTYSDFPGWKVFLNGENWRKTWKKRTRNRYKTWEEAGRAAQKLGITGFTNYHRLRKSDPLLCSTPDRAYPDFPGWRRFLGKK